MDEIAEMDTSFMNSDERAGWNELMEVIKMENQSPQWNIAPNSPAAPQMNNLAQSSASSSSSSSTTPAIVQQSNPPNLKPNASTKPFLRIVEQPASKALRFRYECEGRSAGSIPGVHSTPENKTFPTIEIVNYDKDAIVIVSCVTKDPPYRPHPHKVVGRDGSGQKYENGYCEVKLKGPQLRAVFNNLGIQCVKRREVATSLNLRRAKKINPFNVPYPSNDQKSTYDLNVVRLCFQGFINPTGQRWEVLEPQISDPVIDKKGVFELKICKLCKCSGNVNGGDHIILLCEKVDKNDIRIKFSECNNEGELKWAAYAEFQQSDIHKQTAISFKTPRYERTDISDAVKVYIQLERPTDGGLSEPLEFEYYPDPESFKNKRFKRDKLREELSAVKQNLQSNGLLMTDTNGKFQVPSFTSTGSNLDQTNVFTAQQFKIEPAQSPDYHTINSPYSMTHSPIPQTSPKDGGMQYTPLLTATQNANQFSLPTATAANFLAQWNEMPTITSGGSFTLINNDPSLSQSQNATNPFSLPPNIPFQGNNNSGNNSAIKINFGNFETFCNIVSNAITDNPTGMGAETTAGAGTRNEIPPELPSFTDYEEGLTASGLLKELAGQELMEISNLSVSHET